MAFLNFLKNSNKNIFIQFCNSLKIFNTKKINLSSLTIKSLPSKISTNRISWDGEISSSDFYIAIESKINFSAFRLSQIKTHIKKLKQLNSRNKKLILLTPFDRDWLTRKNHYLANKQIYFLSWSDIYQKIETIPKNKNNTSFNFVLQEYKDYIENSHIDRAGIIQTLNSEVLGEKEFENLNKLKTWKKWHVPSKKFGFDLPNFKVFLYKHDLGLVGYFNSHGMSLNPDRKHRTDYKFYFNVWDSIKILPKTKIINQNELIKLLGYEKFKRWKNRGQSYFVLNKKMVDELLNIIIK